MCLCCWEADGRYVHHAAVSKDLASAWSAVVVAAAVASAAAYVSCLVLPQTGSPVCALVVCVTDM